MRKQSRPPETRHPALVLSSEEWCPPVPEHSPVKAEHTIIYPISCFWTTTSDMSCCISASRYASCPTDCQWHLKIWSPLARKWRSRWTELNLSWPAKQLEENCRIACRWETCLSSVPSLFCKGIGCKVVCPSDADSFSEKMAMTFLKWPAWWLAVGYHHGAMKFHKLYFRSEDWAYILCVVNLVNGK